jgi:prolyl-tRNA synthetase
VKFKDADLVGFPFRATVGPKGLEDGVIELRRRANGETRDLLVARAAEEIVEAVADERR